MKKRNAIRVFLVDDHNMIIQGFSYRLDMERDIEVCGTANSLGQAVPLITELKPDVALIDLNLSDGNGLDLMRTLLPDHHELACIIVTMKEELLFASRFIRAGAKGFIMKSQSLDKVIEAIRTVARGELYVNESIKEQIVSMMKNKDALDPMDSPSDREFEIFCCIGEGMRPRNIADKLCISPGTVDSHCKKIRSKLRLDSMTNLIEIASKAVRG